MYTVKYKPLFIRQYKKYPETLQIEIKEKIQLLKEDPGHPFLKTHKLKGRLDGFWSFSVNYAYRIVFEYESPNAICLLMVGDHDVYR